MKDEFLLNVTVKGCFCFECWVKLGGVTMGCAVLSDLDRWALVEIIHFETSVDKCILSKQANHCLLAVEDELLKQSKGREKIENE